MLNSMSNVEVWDTQPVEYPEDFHAEYAEWSGAPAAEVTPFDHAMTLVTTEADRLFTEVLKEEGDESDFICFSVQFDNAFDRLRNRFPEVIFGLTTNEEDRIESTLNALYWSRVAAHINGVTSAVA